MRSCSFKSAIGCEKKASATTQCSVREGSVFSRSVDYSTIRGGASLSIEIAKMSLFTKKHASLFFLHRIFYNKLDDNLNVVTAILNYLMVDNLICEFYNGNLLFSSRYSGEVNTTSS